MADIKLSNVVKRYGDATVIHGVDLDIKKGEFVVFVGPSGCVINATTSNCWSRRDHRWCFRN